VINCSEKDTYFSPTEEKILSHHGGFSMGGTTMKVGDLVKRVNVWSEWTKYNPWMKDPMDQEIGIILDFPNDAARPIVFISWPKSGYSYEELDDLVLFSKC